MNCSYCTLSFTSRNVLFRHLRDPTNKCGKQVVSNGGIPLGTSKNQNKADKRQALLNSSGASLTSTNTSSTSTTTTSTSTSTTSLPQSKQLGQKKSKPKQKKRNRESTTFATSHTQELWFGGIPSNYSTKKALSVLLWNSCKPGEPTPVVKNVIRKGWRQRVDVRKKAGYIEKVDET